MKKISLEKIRKLWLAQLGEDEWDLGKVGVAVRNGVLEAEVYSDADVTPPLRLFRIVLEEIEPKS